MGCDIHPYCEKKIMGKWILASFSKRTAESHPDQFWRDRADSFPECYFQRDYHLFSALAGVRGDSFVFGPPRGLPDDVSDDVRQMSDDYGVGGHSHSYVTLKELLEWEDHRSMSREFSWTVDQMTDLADGKPEEVRMVFWFDN